MSRNTKVVLFLAPLLFAPFLLLLQADARSQSEDPAVAYLTETYDVSEDEAHRRLEREASVVALARYGFDAYPSIFGGLWVDHERDGEIFIALTDDSAPARDDFKRNFAGDAELLNFQTVNSPHKKLVDAFNSGREQQRDANDSRQEEDYVAMDVERNAILVKSGHIAEERKERYRRHYDGVDVVFVEEQLQASPDDDCDPAWDEVCDPPLRGAVSSMHWDDGPERRGTKGFLAANDDGTLYMLASGHAWRNYETDTVYQRADANGATWDKVGAVPPGGAIEDGGVDAARILIDDRMIDYWKPDNIVWHSYTNKQFEITSRNTLPDEAVPGITLCRGGGVSGSYCGEITQTYADPPGLPRYNMLETSYCGSTGDSGASVYTPWDTSSNGTDHPGNRAFGIHYASSGSDCPEEQVSWASHIRWVEQQHDLEVVTD